MASETVSLSITSAAWTQVLNGTNHESASIQVLGNVQLAAFFGLAAPGSLPSAGQTAHQIIGPDKTAEYYGLVPGEGIWLCCLSPTVPATVRVMRAVG